MAQRLVFKNARARLDMPDTRGILFECAAAVSGGIGDGILEAQGAPMAQTNVAVDDLLLQQAKKTLGGKSDSETVEVALMELLCGVMPVAEPEEAVFEVREHDSAPELSGRESLPVYTDLDWLAGSWSEEEAREFAEATAAFERIDPDPWR